MNQPVNSPFNQSLKIGLIGCGRIAQLVHVENLKRLRGVELVAHADPDPRQRDEILRRIPTSRACTSFEELLDLKHIQAVVICCPNSLHSEVAIHAFNCGKHTYVEKPLATSAEQAQAVLDAWRRSGMVGMIGLHSRFHSLYAEARDALASGQLGDILCAQTVLTSAARDLPAWKERRDTGGGVLLDQAVHHFDLIRLLFGQEVREVFADVRSRRIQDDVAVVHLVLGNGIPIQSSFAYGTVVENRIEIYGQKAVLVIDRHRSLNVEISRHVAPPSQREWLRRGWRALSGLPYWGRKVLTPTRDVSFETAVAGFVGAAQTGQACSPDLWDGYQSLAIALAAEESAKTRRPVVLAGDTIENLARH